MDNAKTNTLPTGESVGGTGTSGSGANDFSSRWARFLAAPPWDGETDEECDRRVEEFLALAWKFWPAAYAYLRCKGCARATIFFDLEQALEFLPLWFGKEDDMHLRRFRPWLLGRLREYLARSMHLVARLGQQVPIAVSPGLCDFDEAVVAALEQRLDGEPYFPEKLFDRAWIVALDSAAWRELRERWPALGDDCPLAPLSEFRLDEPTAAEYGHLSHTLEMSREEVAMAVSRLHRRFRESLREQVCDTVTCADELEIEWAELFPELESKMTCRDE